MSKKSNALLISLLITVGLFIYLTLHHYSVKLGLSGNGLCNISEKLNCDAAASSSFSELFGIPVAIFGGTFNLMIFSFVLFLKFGWIEKSIYSLSTLKLMVAIPALASIILGLISVIYVKVLCPFCLATYVFSIINLVLGWSLFKVEPGLNIQNYLNEYRSHLFMLVAIPLLSWMVAGMIQENNGVSEVKKVIPEKIIQWKASPENQFNLSEGLIRPGTDSKITVVEFADFKCPHCKNAANTINAFLKGNPRVTFIFKPFPLDGTCNKAIPNKGDGTRCSLAGWVLCADKLDRKGWEVLHWIFDKQEELAMETDVKPFLSKLGSELKIDTARIAACTDANETYELISRLAQEGNLAQVKGTPTIYMNGKRLPYGQFLDVLKSAAAEIQQ